LQAWGHSTLQPEAILIVVAESGLDEANLSHCEYCQAVFSACVHIMVYVLRCKVSCRAKYRGEVRC
jgi:hypothetical protein